ncbi:MAG: tetratricopeptide repeat protein [Tannerellaceae bacterium]|nr:tetratricopeptide repeat protein [Tannerellaceae bacterium]
MQRYFTACKNGNDPYFDADEIDAILESFEEKEDYTYYEVILTLGLRLHPGNPDLQLHQCRFLMYNEEYRWALNLVESIAEMNNQDMDLIRLECYYILGEYLNAAEYLEKLAEAKCEYLEDLFEYMAPTLVDMEMRDEASDLIKRGLQIFPNNLLLKDELCYLYEVEGNFEEGIRICNELIDKEPYSYDYWFMLGRLYSLANDFDNAIDAFDFALTCDDSDNNEVKVLKAYCLFMNENYEKALEVYSEIEGDDISIDYLQSLVAECYIKLEDYEQAYLLLKDMIIRQTEANDASVYISFIRCCIETDRENEASQMLVKAADIFPDNVRILSLLALNYLENGKQELALHITGKILENLSSLRNHTYGDELEEYERLFKEGQSLFSEGMLKKAAEYYQELLQAIPQLSFQNQSRYVPPEDLTKEYLNDKNNSN